MTLDTDRMAPRLFRHGSSGHDADIAHLVYRSGHFNALLPQQSQPTRNPKRVRGTNSTGRGELYKRSTTTFATNVGIPAASPSPLPSFSTYLPPASPVDSTNAPLLLSACNDIVREQIRGELATKNTLAKYINAMFRAKDFHQEDTLWNDADRFSRRVAAVIRAYPRRQGNLDANADGASGIDWQSIKEDLELCQLVAKKAKKARRNKGTGQINADVRVDASNAIEPGTFRNLLRNHYVGPGGLQER